VPSLRHPQTGDLGDAESDVDHLPVDAPPRRTRLRRGGPRTPLPLLPLIAVAAGIGIAYVSQTAHATQATYQAGTLAAIQQQLRGQDDQLGNELARLQSSARIVAAAQQLGMRQADRWAYIAAHPVPVLPATPAPQLAGTAGNAAVQQLVAALSGISGPAGSGSR
jgi:hypothetical protein